MWCRELGPGRGLASIVLFWVMVLPGGGAVAADDAMGEAKPEVRVWRKEGAVEIEAAMDLRYPSAEVWDVVLDYDSVARYMPNVDSSRVLSRSDDVVRVRRVGGARFIFRRTYRFELEFEHVAPDSVAFRQVAGDLAGFSGSWTVEPREQGVHLRYRATLAYGLGAPWFLGGGVLRKNVRKMMPAIQGELARRHPFPDGARLTGDGEAGE